MTEKNLKNFLFFTLIASFLFFAVVFAASPPSTTINSSSSAYVNESNQITVLAHITSLDQVGHYIAEINFGDGAVSKSDVKGCIGVSPIGIGSEPCPFVFNHSYSTPGTYQISARTCNVAGSWNCSDWVNFSITVQEKPPPPPRGGDGNGGGNGGGGGASIDKNKLNPLFYQKFGELFDNIVGFLLYLSIMLLVLGIIFGGFLMLNSGSLQNIEKGKKIILLAIGFFAIMLIIKLVTSFSAKDITFH